MKHCSALLMAYPCQFDVADNSSNYKDEIDKTKVFEQYNAFINLLTEKNVKLLFLDVANSTEQVFTRDIGFVVNDIFFVSKLKTPERQRETIPLIKFINQHNIKHHIMQNSIEGGDVVHHENLLFIGVGDRTNVEATNEVLSVLNQNKINISVVPVKFDINKVHLDCTYP